MITHPNGAGRRDCTHPNAHHEHGTRNAYTLDGCRCYPCGLAASLYKADLAERSARGDTALRESTEVRAHVAELQAAGLSLRAISAMSGVNYCTVRNLVAGRLPRVRPATAARLTAVAINGVLDQVDSGRINSTGTRRRLQALMRAGWPVQQIAAQAEVHRGALDRVLRGGLVTITAARAVALAYDRLWNSAPDVSTPEQAAAVRRAQRRAEAAGWAPAMAWDDDTIDNPAAPEPVDVVADPAADENRPVDLDEWLFLVHSGEHPERAAARFGVTLSAVEVAASPKRHNRPDVLAELRGARAASRRWKAQTWAA
jgi:lambda repressor-like predicted transcriptional regulator